MLEERRLLSSAINSAGWTIVTPPATARIVYVSSSTGNDADSGLSAAAPVRSLERGESLLRNGSADEMLLKRGDTWADTLGVWRLSGQSAANPMVIGAYGSGARPELNTGDSPGLILGVGGTPTVNYLDVIGINFHADQRDLASPTYNAAASGQSPIGIYVVSQTNGLLIEDCQVQEPVNEF